MEKVIVKVTATDIANGRRHSACSCPVALACGRYVGSDLITVGTAGLVFDKVKVALPSVVFDFIEHFDAEATVQPFTFEIEVPSDYVVRAPKATVARR